MLDYIFPTPTPHLINIIPNTLVDDFFFWGFVGGVIGYAYYLYRNRKNTERVEWLAGFYGILLSGCVGGLLAIVFDRAIELSILVGLLNQFVYLGLIKSTNNNAIWAVVREVILKMLSGSNNDKK